MSEGFKIVYDRRFPIRPKRPDGTHGCRGCGGDIPKNRKTWCSRDCSQKYNPMFVLIEVRKRDKDICAFCGFNCALALKEWREKCRGFYESGPGYPPRAEYDHIIPFSEGGLTVLENMRTLCSHCHVKRTGEWRRAKAAEKAFTPA